MPNEKKSATRAIRSATKQARGSSIIVPISGSEMLGVELTDDVLDALAQDLDLLLVGDERDHDLHARGAAVALLDRERGLDDRLDLHVVDLRRDDAEPRAARAEHRIRLLELAHAREDALEAPHVVRALAARPLDLDGEVGRVGEELVQRRVEQPDGHREAGHLFEQPLEVLALHRQETVQGAAAVLGRGGEDHRLHRRLTVGRHEHVLGPAQADALGAELARAPRILGRVGVGAHAEAADVVRPAQHRVEVLVDLRRGERDVVGRHPPGGAVDRDEIALPQHGVADAQLAAVEVDVHRGRPRDAGLAHPPGDECRVTGLAALGGEDALRGEEPVHVVGLGERPHEDHATAALRPLDRVLGGEHELPLGGSGRRRDTGRQHVELDVGREARVQERVEPARRRWSGAPLRATGSPRRRHRPRSAPPPAPGAWRRASGAGRGGPPRP